MRSIPALERDLAALLVQTPYVLLLSFPGINVVSAAELARKLDLPIAEVLGRLTSLELDGAVRRHEAGYVRALRRAKDRA